MSHSTLRTYFAGLLADYGMVLVLLALCGYFSFATMASQQPTGAAAGERLAEEIVRVAGANAKVLIVVRPAPADVEFSEALAPRMAALGLRDAVVARGKPVEVRDMIERGLKVGKTWDVIAAPGAVGVWPVFQDIGKTFPPLERVRVMTPSSYRWPHFLKAENLLNIANQIAVIAIIAVGMTMVVITGGIDLSVGSLVAFGAVVATLLIREVGGGEQASALAMILCCAAAIAACGLVGLTSGTLVTWFRLPPFLVTLALMLLASGLAFLLAEGQSIYQVPDSFIWLGRGVGVLGLPHAVGLMVVLYAVAHVVMTNTVFGRYLYAVGGNAEAARLSGVPVSRTLLLAYSISGLLAGLGGIVMASQLKSGSPTYGQMYELYVIAAVVVGGTSLSGGEGKILGTLIGALLIAVIQNGMNLTGVESYTQKVVLGAVILGAVLLDALRRGRWRR